MQLARIRARVIGDECGLKLHARLVPETGSFNMRPRNLLLALVLGLCLTAGAWLAIRSAPPPAGPMTATVLPAGGQVPAFRLVDHSGTPVDESVFVGQWDLVFFGFTNCPDVCPITLGVLAAARREMAADGMQTLPRIVLVSVDPDRDTPDSLARYLDSFGDGTLGITGEESELRKLTDGLGIFFDKREPNEDGYYVVDHSAAVLLIDPDGRFHALFGTPHAIENFVHDLPVLMSS